MRARDSARAPERERSEAERSEGLQIPAQSLLALDRLEQRLEVALAERGRAVPFDHFEEQRRAVLRRLREDLQEIAVVVSVGEDAQPPQVAVVLFDLANAVLNVFVV